MMRGAVVTLLLAASAAAAVGAAKADYALLPLPYAYDALEPHIDEQTMRVHHQKHHQTYTNNLNAVLKEMREDGLDAVADMDLEDVMVKVYDLIPQKYRMRWINAAGGYVNHNFFWNIMTPEGLGLTTTDNLMLAIKEKYAKFELFKQQFETQALSVFGSGWAWLVCDPATRAIGLRSTQNQESPYMLGLIPIIGLDVWEHAYYLKYQSDRRSYISEWWSVVNWREAAAIFDKHCTASSTEHAEL